MSVEELSRSLPEAFEALLFEDGNATTVRLRYHDLSKVNIQGLLEELPPYVRIDWREETHYSHDDKLYHRADPQEFDFFKLLDPRLILNYKVLEVARTQELPQIKGQLILGRYNTLAMDLPANLIDWFKNNEQTSRPVIFVIDDRPMIRLMSQPDIPPSRSAVSLFFQQPGERVNVNMICLSLSLAVSEIRKWQLGIPISK